MLIAEIGQNHCGDMSLAKLLIREAKDNGADLVKFQLYDHNELYSDNPNIPNVELSHQDAIDLFFYGRGIGVEVFFSVFDKLRVQWCEQMGVKRYKIAKDCKPTDVLDAIMVSGKPCYISFRFQDLVDTKSPAWAYIGYIQNYKSGKWKALFCPDGYPQQIDTKNLFINLKFNGISDHTLGLDFAKSALELSQKHPQYPCDIIEKHFAIDHETGIDARWSMTPSELRELRRFSEIVKKSL